MDGLKEPSPLVSLEVTYFNLIFPFFSSSYERNFLITPSARKRNHMLSGTDILRHVQRHSIPRILQAGLCHCFPLLETPENQLLKVGDLSRGAEALKGCGKSQKILFYMRKWKPLPASTHTNSTWRSPSILFLVQVIKFVKTRQTGSYIHFMKAYASLWGAIGLFCCLLELISSKAQSDVCLVGIYPSMITSICSQLSVQRIAALEPHST